MSNASISTILKALIVGIPRQGKVKVLIWDLICLTREVWILDQGGGLFYNRSKSGLHYFLKPLQNLAM